MYTCMHTYICILTAKPSITLPYRWAHLSFCSVKARSHLLRYAVALQRKAVSLLLDPPPPRRLSSYTYRSSIDKGRSTMVNIHSQESVYSATGQSIYSADRGVHWLNLILSPQSTG